MTLLILTPATSNWMCPWQTMQDERIRLPIDQWNNYERTANIRPWEDGVLWPNTRFNSGDPTVPLCPVGQDLEDSCQYEAWQLESAGCQSQLRITGSTTDSSGNPIGNCIVQGFVTSTGSLVGQVTSDTAGYFELPTPYASTNHFLVVYLSGSPDSAGSSANNLQPS